MTKLQLILHTIIHLRLIQICYQIWYRLRKVWRKLTGLTYPLSIKKEGIPLSLLPVIPKNTIFQQYQFIFLNQSITFSENNIDWSYLKFGKLWTYNLNYMDFLNQKVLPVDIGLSLIENYIETYKGNSIGKEPYTIALRGINWIKFFTTYSIPKSHFNNSLYAQYCILLDNIEYHLLGNHLLEDGFSLLYGAFYFKDDHLYQKAKLIISHELKEQVLKDGGHFELSPMYHQIILDRLLDCINLVQNNSRFADQTLLLDLMETKASEMLQWLNQMTFSNGEIALLNDSATNIAPTTVQLNDYAKRLKIKLSNHKKALSDSGYRRFDRMKYECIIDVGSIVPCYQPGHAHADTFNFVLNVKNEPILVDSGISTYNTGETRLNERGTAAHNTVTVQDENSSEVWSSFRVAKRAKVKILKDEKNHVIVQHDGYKKLGTTHQREWHFTENQIEISDTLTGKKTSGTAHFHFAPSIQPQKTHHGLIAGNISFTFNGANEIKLIQTQIPDGYNRFLDNYTVDVNFKNALITEIKML